MKKEPSLLDYLKSVLDPRQERIRLKDLENEISPVGSAGPDQLDEAKQVAAPEAEEESIGLGVEKADEGPVEVLAAQALPESGPFPWRTFASIGLALAAQGALEPPTRLVNMGVFLYLAAFALGIWAVISEGELFPRMPRVRYRPDSFETNRTPLFAAIPLAVLAFIVLGGNKFNTFNVLIWMAAVLFLSWGLWQRSKDVSLDVLIDRIKPPYELRITRWVLAVVIGFAITLFFRFYQLDLVPFQMFSDHAEKLQDVQDVLNGETRIFFPRNTGREFVQMYLTAFTAKYLNFGLSFMALKMGTALAGLLTLPFIYLLGKELANRRVGLFAMVTAGMSYWLNVITRVALRFSLYPLFVAPTLFFIVRGLRRGNRNDFIWAGLFLGLGLHGYSPFRFVPLLVVAAVLLFIFHVKSDQKRMQALWHLGVVIAVSLFLFLPLLRFMSEGESNRSLIMYRGLTRITSVEAELPGNPVQILADNMWDSFAMFAWENGNTWVHSVVFRPALDVFSGAFFYLGYILLFYRYLRQRNWEDGLLLLSVPFLMLPSVFSLAFPNENPSLNRSGGAIIPVFIIASMTLEALYLAVKRWTGARWGTVSAWSVVALLLFWSSAMNYDLVFRQYRQQFDFSSWNTTELGEVIRGFADSVGTEDTAWVVPWAHWVDTRLVGINAGVYIKDYAIQRDDLGNTLQIDEPKLFLFHVDDLETEANLIALYPDGNSRRYVSSFSGKDFMVYFVP